MAKPPKKMNDTVEKVAADIRARDDKDIDAVKNKPLGVDFNGGGPFTYRKMSKMEKMAYDDAAKRRGFNEEKHAVGRRIHIVVEPGDE